MHGYSSSNKIKMIKPRRVGLSERVTRMEVKSNAKMVLVGSP
jgi:hypothetical protein